MTKQEDIWQSRYYTIPRLYMRLTGLWPYHPTCNRYLRFVPTFTICSIIFIPMLRYVHVAMTDLNDLFECMPTILITIICSFKLAILMANSEKIKTCFKTIENDWLSLNTDSERAILQRHALYGQYLTMFYTVFMVTIGLLYIFKSIVLLVIEDTSNSTKITKLPFRVEYGYRINQYFYPILIHCYLTVYSHTTAIISADTFYFILIQHACGMFSIVGENNFAKNVIILAISRHMLEHIGKDIGENFNLKPDKISDDDYNKVFNCLRKHLHVIEFAELIESTFTQIFLISVSLNMIGGSLCGIQVLMNLNDPKDIIAPLAIYIAQLTHLFFHFWQAQFLLDYSTIPYESICRANWYHTSERCKKLLLLIMNRTVSPCRITVGKIATMSIESFGVVLKTSMSYFTMLRSFHQ